MELSQQLSHESTSSRESGYVSEPEKASQQNIRQSTGSSFDSSFPIEEVDSEPEIKLNHSAARKVARHLMMSQTNWRLNHPVANSPYLVCNKVKAHLLTAH